MNTRIPALLLALAAIATAAPERPLRRFLFAVSSEDGGPGKTRLRYSRDDTREMADVLAGMGGVAPHRSLILHAPDSASLLAEFAELSRRMAESRDSGNRVELLIYYSGHSDESGLLLGSSRLPYVEFRRTLETAPAEMRVAVLDACASGAALRTKGGSRLPAFHIDGTDRLRGQAFVTSSRAEEASLESDKLRGSVFTRSFVAGLRGAADADGDGRITLLEAYRYAYAATVSETARTRNGAQHPEYDLDLSGSGDVVLTDLRQAGSRLALEGPDAARVEIADLSGTVVATVEKPRMQGLDLGLPAGSYRMRSCGANECRIARVDLPAGARMVVAPSPQDSIEPLHLPPNMAAGADASGDTGLVLRPLNLGVAPPVSINATSSARAWNLFSLDLAQGRAARVDGIQIATGWADARRLDGMQVAMVSSAGRAWGLQMGAFLSRAEEGGGGIQTALFSSHGGTYRGLQAGIGTLSTGRTDGAQVGVVAWGDRTRGGQIAVLNIGGSVSGVQAGVINIARSSKGAQIGVLNIASESDGAQVGVLNLAGTARGLSVGVSNIARRLESFPLGIASLGLDMEPQIETWADEAGWTSAGLRMDGRRFHSRLAFTASLSDPGERVGVVFGSGAHWRGIPDWSFEGDLLGRSVWNLPGDGDGSGQGTWSSATLSAHRRFGPAWFFAGASWNVLVSDGEDPTSPGHLADPPSALVEAPSGHVRLWPGFFAGIRI